ncbi:hypothetical protein [Microbacterium sp. S1037]|uniref:hypothetical protein n=1 Tax=Microbacterium sp. S1037 TaxID=3398227 RepID=UPI003AAFD528
MYDPFGQPLDPVTLAVGTAVANDAGSVNGTTGWHQGGQKLTESVDSALLIEMGADPGVPSSTKTFAYARGGADPRLLRASQIRRSAPDPDESAEPIRFS